MTDPVRWGILGPGNIARDFLRGAADSPCGAIVALGARDPAKPGLAEDFPGIRIVAGYQALIEDAEVEAIYVATPHVLHAEWAIAAAQAGKHVLCEKPMGVSAVEVEAMFGAAAASGSFMGEAFMYRHHPLTTRILDLIRSGAIGEVRMIRSSFGFSANPVVAPRLFDPALGGGALLDLACYPVSMAALIAGCATGATLPEPETLKAIGQFGASGVDETTAALLVYPGGIVAELACSIAVRQENVLHILGSTGRLEIGQFWFAGGKTGGLNTIRLIRPDGTREAFPVDEPRHLYGFQFRAANCAIRSGAREFAYPGLGASDSIAVARTVDRWIAEIQA
ncbi:Gfo/Idh/MocA family oxidoreductase [Sphingomonas sp. G-3-2-10]|uniref:Gfo/Idh/MocA family protein n=1 Tax=Sphingomonas sp. G-3-2-10 TaxID=2728838 RepID=UPI00146CF6AB|nr:Gfo/Idh/MocA family oxidoreductase [Sphingomonas sp. G-3-2-10]NML08079.1 Gfo/Idh/MocA family oxidoreductase [Sphingomonas sp. G-3-2-10]